MPTLPQDTTQLLHQIDQEWTHLIAEVAKLTPEQLTTPAADGWAVKDHLAHLTHWEQWLLRHHVAGEPAKDVLQVDADLLEEFDTDAVNAIILERSRNRTLADVLQDLHETHDKVVATLRALPFDKLLQPRYADDPEQRPLLLWVAGDTYEHYQEHSAMLQK